MIPKMDNSHISIPQRPLFNGGGGGGLAKVAGLIASLYTGGAAGAAMGAASGAAGGPDGAQLRS